MAQTARGIFFTALLLGAGLLGAGLLVSISNAQSPTDVQNLQELILTESQTLDLKPGAYRYKILTLKANSKLRLFGSTSILAGKVITEKGARIEYVKGSSPQGQKILTLNAIDAAGLVDLTIIGSGANAPDYAPGQRAATGPAGEGAMSQLVTGAWYEVPYWKNRSASAGGSGTHGNPGRPGENAVDVTLYLPGLKPGATIVMETIGGRGGRGQDGGHGGQGGGSARLHPAATGGPGGPAGPGGRGGDAGKISVFLVVAPADVSKKDEIVKTINFRPSYGAGTGGEPGEPGGGGTKGDTSDHFCIGAGCGAEDGKPGAIAHPGPPGAGPQQGEVNRVY